MADTTPSYDDLTDIQPFSPWNWWVPLTAVLMVLVELCWLVPWYRLLTPLEDPGSMQRGWIIFGGIMLLSFLFAQLMNNLQLLRNLQFGVLDIFLVLCLIISAQLMLGDQGIPLVRGLLHLEPSVVLIIALVIWLWWRGVSLAREAMRPIIVWRRFEFGLYLLIAYVFVNLETGTDGSGFGLFIFYLFVGFLANITARRIYAESAFASKKLPFDRRWFLSMVLLLGVLILISAILGSLMTGQKALLLQWVGSAIKFIIAVIMFIILLPGVISGAVLLKFLEPYSDFVRSKLPAVSTPVTGEVFATPMALLNSQVNGQQLQVPQVAMAILIWIVILLLVGFLFYRSRQARAASHRQAPVSSVESLLGNDDKRRLLRDILDDMSANLSKRLHLSRRVEVAALIRRIYAQLMDLFISLNRPRPESMTPLEFLPIMSGVLVNSQDELAMITQVYLRVRYGDFPELDEERTSIESAWQKIAAEGKKLIDAREVDISKKTR